LPKPPDTSPDIVAYWLALLRAPGVGPAGFQRLLQGTPTLADLFGNSGQTLIQELDLPAPLQTYLRAPDWPAVENDLAWAEASDCHILTLNDARYPALLQEIPDPPPVLFVRGKSDILAHAQLAMVGSRNPSAGGRQSAYDFAQALTRVGLTITSGLALGIDAASHEGALAAGGDTIAVAGTGLDRIYPARHRELGHRIVEQGAMVSEFPPGTPPLAHHFPRRNRIISGLSLGTCVIEATLKNGSLITTHLAAEQGREVFTLPGSIHNPLSRGCHALIRQGAKLTEDIGHILEELGPLALAAQTAVSPGTTVDSNTPPHLDEHPLFENMGYEPTSIDTLVDRSGLTPEVVSSMLLTLELQGHVTSAGGLYSRTY
jgi:DNA processing protein